MNWLNGWQRIGVILSALWCMTIVGGAAIEHHKVGHLAEAEKKTSDEILLCRENAKKSATPEASKQACGLSADEFFRGQDAGKRSAEPSALSSMFALLFLPIVAFWLLAYVLVWAVRWVIAGFRVK